MCCVFITNPNQEDGVREEREGQGEGSPDSPLLGPPDTVSPTSGLGEDDHDPSTGRQRGEHAGRDSG